MQAPQKPKRTLQIVPKVDVESEDRELIKSHEGEYKYLCCGSSSMLSGSFQHSRQ